MDLVVAHYRDRPKYDFGDVVMRLDLMSGGLKRVEEKLDEFMELGVSVPDEPVAEGRYDAGARMLGAASLETLETAAVMTFNCVCQHCGDSFEGATRYATLCEGCQGRGHRNVLSQDCRACQAGHAA